jgi:hypothetical protein
MYAYMHMYFKSFSSIKISPHKKKFSARKITSLKKNPFSSDRHNKLLNGVHMYKNDRTREGLDF